MAKVRVLILLITFTVVGIVGSIALLYARGYRLGREKENITLNATGLLVLNSDPTGAQVFVNGELKTATNNTITLEPDTYEITLKKEGFLTWQKILKIEKEVVTQIDAYLIQSAPSLTALTFSGALNPVISPDNTQVAYAVPVNPEENGTKAGLWVIELTNLPLGFSRDPRQITDGDLSDSTWEWSPNGRQILLNTKTGSFLLESNQFTPQAKRLNATTKLAELKKEWNLEAQKRTQSKLEKLEDEIESVFIKSAKDISFAPDESKILYTASSEAALKEGLVKPLPGASTQKEQRAIKKGESYVYDIKEDKNFKVGEAGEKLYWLANSLNLLLPKETEVDITDYDGTNKKTVFSGSYTYPHVYPASGNRLLLLTSFANQKLLTNLYSLSLK